MSGQASFISLSRSQRMTNAKTFSGSRFNCLQIVERSAPVSRAIADTEGQLYLPTVTGFTLPSLPPRTLPHRSVEPSFDRAW